jgi:hypothetical protein
MKEAINQLIEEDKDLKAYYINDDGWERIKIVGEFLAVILLINTRYSRMQLT